MKQTLWFFYIVKLNRSQFKFGITRENKLQNRLYTLRTGSFQNATWIGYTAKPMPEKAVRVLESEFKADNDDSELCTEAFARNILKSLNYAEVPFKVLNKFNVTMPKDLSFQVEDKVRFPVTSEMEKLAVNNAKSCVIAIGARNMGASNPRIKDGKAKFNLNGKTYHCVPSAADLACVKSFDQKQGFGERVVELEVYKVVPMKLKSHVAQTNPVKRRKTRKAPKCGPKSCDLNRRHHGISQGAMDARAKTGVDFTKKAA